jgi:serine/threonine protein kinase
VIVDRGLVAAALPGYRLGGELGAGSFGLVIEGWHRQLARPVAIKAINAEPADPRRSGEVSGFTAEAAILAGFDHPHIVRVYDYQERDGVGLIVMELLAGGNLTRRLAGLPRRPPRRRSSCGTSRTRPVRTVSAASSRPRATYRR